MKSKKIHLLSALLMLVACHRAGVESDVRTEAETASYKQTIDSVDALSPRAMHIVDSMLSLAPDSQTYYEYYVLKGRLFLHTAHPDSALHYYQSTIRFAQQQPDSRRTNGLLAIAYNSEGAYYHLMRRNNEQTIQLYQMALQAAEESDLSELLPDIAANLGDAYIQNTDLPKGAALYRRALFLVDSLRLPESRNITLYMGLGQIYTTLKDYETALKYYQLTDKLFNQMNPTMQAYFLNNFGNCYYYMGDYQRANQLFSRMKQHVYEHQGANSFDMALCKVNLADVNLNLDHTNTATRYVNEAEAFFRDHGIEAGVAYANIIKIGIALKENRLAEAGQLIGEQAATGLQLEYNLLSVREKYLCEYYQRTGKYREAYEHLKQNIARRDSAEHNRQHMIAAEIMMRLQQDTLQLHHQLALKEKDAASTRAHTALGAAIGVVVLLSLLCFVLITNIRKRRLQQEMDLMHLKLADARNRISPHFIFNVLNNEIVNHEDSENLTRLSALIRQNLDLSSKAYVTLAEEIGFVRQYIEIEAPLLQPDFTYTIETPREEVMQSIMVPTMMVQILVENSIVHALKGKEGAKLLSIKAEHDAEQTTLSVTDNGNGFDIRHQQGRPTKNGLRIITHTIQVINQRNRQQNRMHFSVRNMGPEGQPTGCTATITIPNNIVYI